jgi:DNA-directed RNA polymerase specialized sigma24 family protein
MGANASAHASCEEDVFKHRSIGSESFHRGVSGEVLPPYGHADAFRSGIVRVACNAIPRGQEAGKLHVAPQETLQEDRGLTPTAFKRLLEWLDDGTESHGETYLEMRRRLVAYFERRDRRFADELADETLNRVGLTLDKSGTIAVTPPARYCYVVARYVLLEDFRRDHAQVALDDDRGDMGFVVPRLGPADPQDPVALREERLDCLDRCLQTLKPEQRELVVEYYRDHRRQKIDRRRALAARLGISMNALAIRACRIRSTLEACVEGCRAKRQL